MAGLALVAGELGAQQTLPYSLFSWNVRSRPAVPGPQVHMKYTT